MSRIAPDDEDGGFADCIGCNRIDRFQGTGGLHLPSNKIQGERDDRVYALFRVGTVVFRFAREKVALRDNLRSTIGIGWSFECSGPGSRG